MMSDYQTIDGGMTAPGTLTLSDNDRKNLRTAGKWARLLAIVGLVIMGFMFLAIIGGGTALFATMLGSGLDGAAPGALGGTFVIVIYGLLFLFSAYIYYLLYKFGSKAVTAVDTNDTVAMSESLASLGSMFKILGILMAIYLGFVALGLVAALIGGAAFLIG